MTTQVAFVLRLLDDFTGKTIQRKKFQFYQDGRLMKPVEKEEGLYVFLEPLEPVLKLVIYSSDYHPRQVLVDRSLLPRPEPVHEVRLHGRPGGSFDYRYELVEGKLSLPRDRLPAKVCVPSKTETGLTLSKIIRKDENLHLQVHGLTRAYLVGKTFMVSTKKKAEVFVIQEKLAMNEFRITGELTGTYPDQTPIQRVYCSITDNQGEYGIFVEPGEQEESREVMVLQDR